MSDWSGKQNVTAFSEAGEKLFRKTAEEIGEILDKDSDKAEKLIFGVTLKPKLLKLRTNVETYKDEVRQKTTVVDIGDVNHKDYNKHLLDEIQKCTGISTQNKNQN